MASFKLANPSTSVASNMYYHWVTFIFVKKELHGAGIGSKMLQFIHTLAWGFLIRPIRANAARKSIGFFKNNGYREVNEMTECVCPGGGIFRYLQMMELMPPESMIENWDE